MKKYCFMIASLLVMACSASKPVAASNIKNSTHKFRETCTPPSQEDVEKVKKIVKETKSLLDASIKEVTLQYVEQYAPFAMEEMRKYKIPASITIAQGILESNSGLSTLSLQSNNHFGIKCHKGWEGDFVTFDDDEKGECFRKYEYPTTSYQDHSIFLTSRPRYASLFMYEKDDYISWAKGLKAAGYATDPAYPEKLIAYIEKYELYKYDQLVLGNDKYVFKKYVPTAEDSIRIATYMNKNLPKANPGCHVVNYQETLFSISKKYGITVDELKSLNALVDNNIKVGQQVRVVKQEVIDTSLSKKGGDNVVVNAEDLVKPTVITNSVAGIHVVQPKETLFFIAKKYNITVEQLKKINQLTLDEIKVGQNLKTKE